jgi:ATP-binding cassette subfamily B protein
MSESFTSRLRPVRETLNLPLAVGAVLLTLTATVLALWLPRLLGAMVDNLVSGDFTREVLLRDAAIYIGVALVGALFSKWMRQVPMRWGPQVAHHVRTRVHRHVMKLDEDQVHDLRVGEVMSRLQSDVNSVADMLALGGHCFVRATFTLGFSFTFMFSRSPELALVMSGLLPTIVVIGFVMIRSIRKRHLEVQEQLGILTTYCQESFYGLRILRGLGLDRLRTNTFRGLNQEFIRRSLALSRVEIFAWPLIMTAFVFGNVLLLWAGGRQVIRGEIELGMLVEFQQYLMILQWPTLSIAWALSLVLRGRASLGRLQEVMSVVPRIPEAPEGAPEVEPGPVCFENVSLTLGGKEVLKDLSFETRPHELLGITGPTGSGKTLLMQLLLRRHDPDQGRVTLGGTDLRDLPLDSLYSYCRIAPQEPVMFSMSLRENLLMAQPDADEAAIQEALRISALDQDLVDLPEGLDSAIGERGVTLSGGQRQRSSIARALLGNPKALLLDDSLSAVDTTTESRILERLLPKARGRMVWLVSHRYAALRHCDRVIVLEEGRITELGPPAELVTQGGYFTELEQRQRLQAELEAES